MTTTLFYRLAWKEYRQQRDLLIAIALITVAIMAAMIGWHWVENQTMSPGAVYHIALLMPVFYALGCGATLFAGERERETFSFLRSLPLQGRQAYWPKLAVAVVSTLGLTALLALVAALFTLGRAVDRQNAADLTQYFLIMPEVLAWSMLFSLLLRHPLWAIAAGGIAYFASLVVWLIVVGTLIAGPSGDPNPASYLGIYAIGRCVLLVLVAIANLRLGASWLEREEGFQLSTPVPADEIPNQLAQPTTRFAMFCRLWWQSLRESGWVVAAVYAALFLFSVFLILNQAPGGMVWGCLPALIGPLAFFHDQWKQNYRFFAEHGVDARTVWWARILGSFAVCAPWLVFIAGVALLSESDVGRSLGFARNDDQLFHGPFDLLVLGVLCFAWGQWCSLLFRAGIVGVFVGVAMSLILVFVVAALRFLGIPDWLGVYLPAAVMLWASWRRAPDWLAERNSWGRWLRYSALVSLPVLAIVAGMIAHRAYEIPALIDTTLTLSVPGRISLPKSIADQHPAAFAELQRSPTAEELETARLYRELWGELRQLPERATAMGAGMPMGAGGFDEGEMGSAGAGGPPGAASPGIEELLGAAGGSAGGSAGPVDIGEFKKARAEKLAGLVERFVEISRRPNADFVPDLLKFAPREEMRMVSDIEVAVLEDARRLDDAKEFDAALERHLALIRFARHYQQRGELQRIQVSLGLTGRVYDHLLARAARIEQPTESLLALQSKLQQSPFDFVPDYELAWLREYAFRKAIVDLDPTAWEAQGWSSERERARWIFQFIPWERTRSRRFFDFEAVTAEQGSRAQLAEWQQNTFWVWISFRWRESMAILRLLRDTQQAAIRLRLLLLAYQHEQGELPESLAELEMAYAGKVPLDPATHLPWTYRPHGEPGEGTLQQPFIWSPSSGYGRATIHPGNDPSWIRQGTMFDIVPLEP